MCGDQLSIARAGRSPLLLFDWCLSLLLVSGSSAGAQKRAYVPPHMRGKESAAPTQSAPAPAAEDNRGPAPSAHREERAPQTGGDARGSGGGGFGGRDSAPRGNFGGRDVRQDGPASQGGNPRFDRGGEDRPSYGGDRNGGGAFGGRSNAPQGGGGGGRFSRDDVRSGAPGGGGGDRRGGPSLEPRDARLEEELFGGKRQNSGIEFKNYDDIPVETSGHDVPEPISKFSDMEIHEVLKSNIELSGYDHPTPVQRYGLPIALAGRDVMACAQTGSGSQWEKRHRRR